MRFKSLRARLIVIILTPLLIISVAAALWQFRNTTERAEEIFDRGLLSAALAISRDVTLSGGDALSPATRRLISDTSGGELFYHVYAPDGVFITGYATPPVRAELLSQDISEPQVFDATYLGKDVRVLRFQDAATVEGLSGVFTVTVWQNMSVRLGFARDVVSRTVAVISLLVLSVALVVWFGVRIGLRPLLDLEDAIARRSASELEPIRRPVPREAQGLVSTLNLLLERVSRRISSKDEFISNAAHQLRNPIAGVLALAEAVESAPTAEASKSRSKELLSAARDVSHLTNQLLSFERAAGTDLSSSAVVFDLGEMLGSVAARFEPVAEAQGVALRCELGPEVPVSGDKVMLQEAVLNLLNNSLVHGGTGLSWVKLGLDVENGRAVIGIADDGVGIASCEQDLAIARFSQAKAGPGTGLGLPIARRVAVNHGGDLVIEPSELGVRIRLEVPLSEGLA